MDAQRTRETSGSTNGTYPWEVWRKGVKINSGSSTLMSSQWSKTMTDTKHEDFKRRVSQGEVINSFASKRDALENYGSVPFTNSYKGSDGVTNVMSGTFNVSQCIGPTEFPPSCELDPDDRDQMMAGAFQDAQSSMNKSYVNLAENAAEWRQTMNLVLEAYKVVALLTGRAKLKRDAFKRLGTKGAAREASNAWLQWRYGVRPLIYTVQGAVDALRKKLEPRYTARGLGFDSLSETETFESFYAFTTMRVHCTTVRTGTYQASSGVLYSFCSKLYDRLQRFGMNDLFTLSWELVPYSFVIDWFIPVGKMLSALAPVMGTNTLAQWTTLRSETREKLTVTLSADTARGGISASGQGSYEHVVSSWERYPRELSFLLYAPSFDVNLDIKRLLDGVALLAQLRLGLSTPRRTRLSHSIVMN